ncbi:class I SAM-dependent methyltransferase [Halogeometricum luteum]|uniref:Class I SAM-dependent methyltransferase n=1 Tax=Halogeometricum luteum TaxID=2950537 RepID=A0ABU2G441_9EURY|nr:class I SAM-dependent methyltransferase [Halogeometricum sp. S3BR5-2]MDS0295048.1 class I SAM-dependent methyltransferase [Halogeometricum sp. S3BR5-2]
MDVPRTVRVALADRPVAGATCLEAGAGVGKATAGLLDAGAAHVYAVTNDRGHARLVRERLAPDELARATVLEADLRAIPLPADAVDVVTAHALFNVVPVASLAGIVFELTRVAAPGAHLVVDDYEPLPEDAAVRELFALENAATELADGRPALTFYERETLRAQFEARGWAFDRERTLLDPVPWTENHVAAHANVVRRACERLPTGLGEQFASEADRLAGAIGSESVGEMYGLAFRLSDDENPTDQPIVTSNGGSASSGSGVS